MASKQFKVLCLSLLMIPLSQANYGDGIWLFGGAGAGLVLLNTKEVNPNTPGQANAGHEEQDKKGYGLQFKIGPSWYFSESFVGDAMIGWDYSKVKGSASVSGDTNVTIRHQVGFFSLSPRYRFGDRGVWQIGPIYKLKFGTDTSYTEREGQNINEKPLTHYLGAHLNWDIPSESEKWVYRLGLEPMMDISNPRTIITVNLLFELGFKLFDKSSHSYQEPARVQETPTEDLVQDLPSESYESVPDNETEVADDTISARSSGNQVYIRFPGDVFHFGTGMSHIGSQVTKNYLRDLGAFLAENQSAWQSGSVIGHTDRRGPKGREREVNMELSNARAATVKNALVNAGVDSGRLSSLGKAFDEPVPGAPDNQAGWKLNRRVELSFEGVKAPADLISQINALNKKYGFSKVR